MHSKEEIFVYAIDENKMVSEPFYKKVCSFSKKRHWLFLDLKNLFNKLTKKGLK